MQKLFQFLTGAGVSAESGVPTFRDKGGIWEKFNPEELANFEAFINNRFCMELVSASQRNNERGKT